MKTVQDRVAQISQSFHDGLDDIDKLRIQNLQRAIDLAAVRIESGAAMEVGAGTIRRQDELIVELGAAREKHIRAHRSAMTDAVKMGWPTECPRAVVDGAEAGDVKVPTPTEA